MMRWIPVILGLVLAGRCSAENLAKTRPLPEAEKAKLVDFLEAHAQSPEDYVIGKFADHDLVFLGEYHRIRHDVLLVQALIPRLYAAGVYNLGFEFASEEDQALADSVVNAETYDEPAVRRMLFETFSSWGFREYEDVYRKVWELNRTLPADAPRFRIVHLAYKARFELMTENPDRGGGDEAARRKVWFRGDPDAHMAEMIFREIAAKGQKALIYSGIHHAFTRYRQPQYDFERKQLTGLNQARMGNIVYDRLRTRTFTIFLHAPWPSAGGFDDQVYPAGGVIDEVMRNVTQRRVGFDLAGTPFGELRDPECYYSLGHPDFKLADFADGYIFQMPLGEYQGCTVDTLFVTQENLTEAVARIPNPAARKFAWTPESLRHEMERDTDFKRRFAGFR